MASILKRGEYSYQVVIRRKGYPTKTRTFELKADAEKWARMIEREMDRGLWQESGAETTSTLGDVLRRYMNDVTPLKKGAEIERTKINAILRDSICERRMDVLSGADIASWRDRRLRKVKGATVNREMAIIRHAVDIARKEWGMRIRNPCELVRRCAGSKARERRLAAMEQQFLMAALDAVKSPYVKPLVIMSIETSMRRGESLALLWKNIDLDKRTAYLPDSKNGDGRYVALSSVAVAILRDLPRESGETKVFPITADALKKAFVRSLERARTLYEEDCRTKNIVPSRDFLVNFRFHDLRHEAASRLFEKGLNIMEVASITGHKTLQMLQRYTHLRAENLAKKLG